MSLECWLTVNDRRVLKPDELGRILDDHFRRVDMLGEAVLQRLTRIPHPPQKALPPGGKTPPSKGHTMKRAILIGWLFFSMPGASQTPYGPFCGCWLLPSHADLYRIHWQGHHPMPRSEDIKELGYLIAGVLGLTIICFLVAWSVIGDELRRFRGRDRT